MPALPKEKLCEFHLELAEATNNDEYIAAITREINKIK